MTIIAHDDIVTYSGIIPAINLPALKEKIAKMNRRAKRLGCEPIMITIGDVFTATKHQTTLLNVGQETRKIRIPCHKVTIVGIRPQIPGGWKLVARVQLLDNVNILHKVPGCDVPEEFHNTTNRCDHCHVNRARNDVFVLYNGATYMVVGRTCIADFLGGIQPSTLAWYAESLAAIDCRDFEDYDGSGPKSKYEFDVEKFLAASAAAIRVYGWISRKSVVDTGKSCTADYASLIYASRDKEKINDDDRKEAEDAIAWATTINPDNDYMVNVQKIADLSFAPWNLSGIAASIINAYQRYKGRTAVAKQDQKISQHQGMIGARETWKLTVFRINSFESAYGLCHIHTFYDANGNVFKWFSSSVRLNEGDNVVLKGTVKKHTIYKGIQETELTRCVIQKP
jgi:hypothetical protein